MNNSSRNYNQESYSHFAKQWVEAGRRLLEERGLSVHSLPVISNSAVDSDRLRVVLKEIVDSVAQISGETTAGTLRQIQRHLGVVLSRDSWRSIHTQHWLANKYVFRNHLTPLNAEFARHNTFAQEFSAYEGRGRASLTQRYPLSEGVTCPPLTNGWFSEFHCAQSGEILAYFRSGAICHYGELDVERRQVYGADAARMLAGAMAAEQLRRLDTQRRKLVLDGKETLLLGIVTCDLQSTQIGEEWRTYRENMVVKEHRKNMTELEAINRLRVRLSDGCNSKELEIPVAITVLPFNFPVHLSNFSTGLGWRDEVEALNRSSYERLKAIARGDFSKLGSSSERKLSQIEANLDELFRSYTPHEVGADPYRYNTYLINYAYQKGFIPHFNCRSGKDRTGMLDAESKLLAAQLAHGLGQGWNEPLSQTDSDLLFDIAMRGGSAEIQRLNTGVIGSKLQPLTKDLATDPLVQRIGVHRWQEFKGLAGVAEGED